MVDGEGGSSEGCLKGVVGVIKGSLQKHLKTGGGKRQKLLVGGGGFEGVTTPAPRKILIIQFAISNHTALKLDLQALRSYFSQICE